MRETEITVQVFDTMQNVEKQLIKLGFEIPERYHMKDWYFSKYTTDELKAMSYLDIINNSVIVRYICDDSPRTYLVYKKKEMDKDDNVIAEEKYNVILSDTDDARKILNMAGMNNWCEVVNDSIVFSKDGVVFVLQDIEDLGVFIEYEEDESMSNMTDEEKFRYMQDYLTGLNLNLGADFSCKKVYMKFLKENAL